MGTHHKDIPKHKDIPFYLNKMLHFLHLLLAIVGLATAAPRLRGTVQDRHQGTQCRTEYITVWDTEYEERECVTKEECEDELKKIPVRVSKRIAKEVCDGYANPISIPEYDDYDEYKTFCSMFHLICAFAL